MSHGLKPSMILHCAGRNRAEHNSRRPGSPPGKAAAVPVLWAWRRGPVPAQQAAATAALQLCMPAGRLLIWSPGLAGLIQLLWTNPGIPSGRYSCILHPQEGGSRKGRLFIVGIVSTFHLLNDFCSIDMLQHCSLINLEPFGCALCGHFLDTAGMSRGRKLAWRYHRGLSCALRPCRACST